MTGFTPELSRSLRSRPTHPSRRADESKPQLNNLHLKQTFGNIGNLLISSKKRVLAIDTRYVARVVEWLMAPGCKPGRREPYVGSNPTPCTTLISDLGFGNADLVQSEIRTRTSQIEMGGSSSVGRASAFQAECREFESRLPLH